MIYNSWSASRFHLLLSGRLHNLRSFSVSSPEIYSSKVFAGLGTDRVRILTLERINSRGVLEYWITPLLTPLLKCYKT